MSAWLAIAATGTAFDDYIGTISPNYTWYDLNYTVNPPLIRATAHIINVTSQQWLTEAQAVGPTARCGPIKSRSSCRTLSNIQRPRLLI